MVKGKNHKKYFRKKKLEKQKKEKEKIKLFNEITCGNTEEKNSFDFKIPDFIDDKPNKDKNQDNDANISNFNHTLKPSAETPSELNLNELDDIYSLDLNNSGNGIYNFHQIIDNLYTRPNPNLNNETGLNLNTNIFDDDDNYNKFPDVPPILLFNCNKEKDKYEIPNYIKSNFPEIGMKDKDSLNNIDNDNNNSLDIYDNNIDIKSYTNINNNNNAIDNYNSSNGNNNGNNNDNNNDNSIKDTNELKYNISIFQKNQTFFKGIIIKEPPFISPDYYLMTHQESLRRLWEGNNRIFNDVLELRNRTGIIYVDLYNYLAYHSRHKNEKERRFDSDNMAEKIKTYLNKMMYEPFNTLFKDKIKINFQTKKSINNPKNDFNYVFFKIKLRCILSNDTNNSKGMNLIDSNEIENNDLIKYLDSTPEYCLDYFLFNKQDNEGMFNGKNVVDFLFGEIERLRKSKKNIQDNEIKKDYIASLLLLSYNLTRLLYLKSGRGFKQNYFSE